MHEVENRITRYMRTHLTEHLQGQIESLKAQRDLVLQDLQVNGPQEVGRAIELLRKEEESRWLKVKEENELLMEIISSKDRDKAKMLKEKVKEFVN